MRFFCSRSGASVTPTPGFYIAIYNLLLSEPLDSEYTRKRSEKASPSDFAYFGSRNLIVGSTRVVITNERIVPAIARATNNGHFPGILDGQCRTESAHDPESPYKC